MSTDRVEIVRTVKIVRAVQTCPARPSEWNTWTEDGEWIYIRYRNGYGVANSEEYDGPILAEFESDIGGGGEISLKEFCRIVGFELALESN